MSENPGHPEQYGDGAYDLRRLHPENVGAPYIRWMNDPEVNRFLQARFQVWDIDDLRVFASGFDYDNNLLFGIHEVSTEIHVGTVTLRCNQHHNFGTIGFMVGERDYWGRSVAKTAITNALTFAFYERGLRKVIGTTTDNHDASNHIFSSLGFRLDAVVLDLYWSDGLYRGETHYSMSAITWAERLGRDPAPAPAPPRSIGET